MWMWIKDVDIPRYGRTFIPEEIIFFWAAARHKLDEMKVIPENVLEYLLDE